MTASRSAEAPAALVGRTSRRRSLLVYSDTARNVGDFALRRSLYDHLSAYGVTDVVQIVWACDAEAGGDVAAISLKQNLFKALGKLFGRDMLIGPGQIVRDNQSTWSVLSILAIAALVRLGGREAHIIFAGVGPLARPTNRLLWRLVGALAKSAVVRDARSAELAEAQLGMVGRVTLSKDLMFGAGRSQDFLAEQGPRSSVLVSVVDDPGENRGIDVDSVANLAIDLNARAGPAELTLVAHDTREGADTVTMNEVIARIAERDPGVQASAICTDDLEAVLLAYRRARVVLTNRLHSAIFGILAGKPVLVLNDRSGKLAPLAEEFGLAVVDGASAVDLPEMLRHADGAVAGYAGRLDEHRRSVEASADALFSRWVL